MINNKFRFRTLTLIKGQLRDIELERKGEFETAFSWCWEERVPKLSKSAFGGVKAENFGVGKEGS